MHTRREPDSAISAVKIDAVCRIDPVDESRKLFLMDAKLSPQRFAFLRGARHPPGQRSRVLCR
jgi:hypothetical protein